MAFQHIRIKNTNVVGKIPGADKLDVAELCINLKDQKLFSKDADGNVFELGGRVDSGGTPPGSGNEIGDLFWDGDFLLVWNGTEWETVTGDLQEVTDKGNTTDNSIRVGGSGAAGVELGPAGNLTIVNVNDTDMISAEQRAGATKTFTVDKDAHITTTGSVTCVFGTSTAQLGNVAPLNDWSCYPARA